MLAMQKQSEVVLILDSYSADYEKCLNSAPDNALIIIDDITAEMAAQPPLYLNGKPLPPRSIQPPKRRRKRPAKAKQKPNLPSDIPHCI